MYVGVQGKEYSVTYVCAFQLQGNYVWATGHTSNEFKIREAWDWRVRVRNDRVSLGDFWEWQLELGWMRRCSVADIQQNLLLSTTPRVLTTYDPNSGNPYHIQYLCVWARRGELLREVFRF